MLSSVLREDASGGDGTPAGHLRAPNLSLIDQVAYAAPAKT